MPKIVYANLTWFIIISVGAVVSSIDRHNSPAWNAMPDARLNYDLMFVGVFSLLSFLSLMGVYKKKSWGYTCAMTFNYILVSFSITPIVAMLIFSFNNGFTISDLADIDWSFALSGILIGFVSVIFVFFMRKKNVTSIFKIT